ncbi:MAG: 30S ribosomal protein S20 [Thermales bacterium]|nr:30S ribosomal protein S20 [Thermales bacterium]
MPNTSSAKKALRGSQKKRQFNDVKKYHIKQSLKELRKVLATKPSEYQATLSKVFSAFDKAVKTNLIPKSRANRKKSRVSAMVDKALGREVANKATRKINKKAKQANKKAAVPKAKAPTKKNIPKEINYQKS